MNKILKRIEEFKDCDKRKYILEKVVLRRFLVIAVILTLINLVAYDQTLDHSILIRVSILKVLIILVVGVIAGHLEWSFFKSLIRDREKSIAEIKRNYILNYGFLHWSIPLCISGVKIPLKLISLGADVIIWSIAGVFFGWFAWSSISSEFEEFVQNS